MATGKVNQGTWMSKSQGAWQVQAQQHSATLTDSMTGADALAALAEPALSDAMSGADAVVADADVKLPGSGFTNVGHIDDGGHGLGIWGDGTYIYLANYGDGLRAYTFDGSTFINVGHINDGGFGWEIWGDGTYIYLANCDDGLRAYTFDGSTFTLAGHIDDGGEALGVWGDGTYIYLANQVDGLRAYTFNGTTFTNVGHIDDGGAALGVWGDGTYIYLANDTDGLRAYTFNGTTFTNVGHIDDGGEAWGVWGDGTYIYLANDTDGLRAYTFNGTTFTNVGHIDDGGEGRSVWDDGTFIYLANAADGLRAYTFDGSTFVNVGHINNGGEARFVWGDGACLYLANHADGLRAYTFPVISEIMEGSDALSGVHHGEVSLADTATGSDAIVADAETALADSMTGVDLLSGQGHGEVSLSDAMSGADAVVKEAEAGLADSMTGVDSLSSAGHGEVSLADSAVGSDAIVADAEVVVADASAVSESLSTDADGGLADGMSPSDALSVEAGIAFSDSMTGIDALTGAGHGELLLADIAICSDVLTAVLAPMLADSMTGVDVLTGELNPGLLPGIGNEAPHTIDAGSKQPRQGKKTVTNSRSQLTAVSISSANTTFGKLTVTDASAWDLSRIERHYVVVTADGYIGEVESVAGNTVTIRGWIKSNINRHGIAEDKPDDDALVVVFKTIRARRVLIYVASGNTKPVYLGFTRDVDLDGGHPISRHLSKENSSLTIEAGLGKWLNLTKFWLVAGTEQVVRWQTETFVGGGGEGAHDYSVELADSMTGVDLLSGQGHDEVSLADSMTGVDAVVEDAEVILADSMTGADLLSGQGHDEVLLADVMSGVDTISVQQASVLLSDSMTASDDLTGGEPEPNPNCAQVHAYGTGRVSEGVAPTAVSRGDASVDGGSYDNALFQPGRGGWNITINPGGAPGHRFRLAVTAKDWVPFASGTPWTLTETSFDVYVNGGFKASLDWGETWVGFYDWNGASWVQDRSLTLVCGQVLAGTLDASASYSVVASHTDDPYFHFVGYVSKPDELQARPYQDEDGRGVIKTDLWNPRMDYEFLNGSPTPMVTPVNQNPPPRTFAVNSLRPLYYYQDPGPGPEQPYWVDACLSIDDWWSNLPGVTFGDGIIGFAGTGGSNWHWQGNYLGYNVMAYIIAVAGSSNLVGGGHGINMSGGDDGQVIELRITANPYLKWLRIGLFDIWGGLRPYGYFGYNYVGYTEEFSGVVPGADIYKLTYYQRDPIFYWGTGISGPAGTIGVVPRSRATISRLILKNQGGTWVLQYAENVFFLDPAGTAIVNISW